MDFLRDLIWAWQMVQARRVRRRALFSRRRKFDDALRPRLARKYPDERQEIIAYPDAIYHAAPADFARAFATLH